MDRTRERIDFSLPEAMDIVERFIAAWDSGYVPSDESIPVIMEAIRRVWEACRNEF